MGLLKAIATAIIILLLESCSKSATKSEYIINFYPGTEPFHETGEIYDKTGWIVTPQHTNGKFLSYGPYTDISNKTRKCGPYHDLIVSFWMEIDEIKGTPDQKVITLDVHHQESSGYYFNVDREIHRKDFIESNVAQQFNITFQNEKCANKLEFRVYYHCCATIIHHNTTLYLSLLDSKIESMNQEIVAMKSELAELKRMVSDLTASCNSRERSDTHKYV